MASKCAHQKIKLLACVLVHNFKDKWLRELFLYMVSVHLCCRPIHLCFLNPPVCFAAFLQPFAAFCGISPYHQATGLTCVSLDPKKWQRSIAPTPPLTITFLSSPPSYNSLCSVLLPCIGFLQRLHSSTFILFFSFLSFFLFFFFFYQFLICFLRSHW